MPARLRPLALGGALTAVAVTAAACGGGASSSLASAPSAAAVPGTGTASGPPGAFGTIAQVSGRSLEVQNPSTGQVTVSYTSSTTFTQLVKAGAAQVQRGVCVSVTGTPPAGSATAPGALTATSVTISAATATGCSRGFGGAAAAGSGSGFARRFASRSPRPRPSGARAFGAAHGIVTAVSAQGFTVTEKRPNATSATTVQVTTTAATSFQRLEPATPAALKVGQCISALGPADDTGAVTARTISIRPPGPNGCNAGLRRGFAGGFAGAAGGGSGSGG